MSDAVPKLLFCCPYLGLTPDVWMWRQAIGFRHFDVRVLTGGYYNRDVFGTGDIPVEVVEGFCKMPENSSEKFGAVVRGLWGRNTQAAFGAECRAIEAVVKRFQPDVILTQFAFTGLRVLPVARKYRIPLAIYIHGWDLSALIRGLFYRRSLKASLPKIAGFVVVGRHHQRWLEERGVGSDRIRYIPCGAPVGEYPVKDYNASREDEALRFITLSRLVEMKGVEYSIRAFAQVVDLGVKVHLDVVGEGPLRVTLEQLAEGLGLGDRVRFHGALPPERVKKMLVESDILLQHSIIASNGSSEGFGVSLAEASSCGLPVVCSDSPGLIDQVVDGETGFLVRQRDVAAMAERMTRLIRDPELRKGLGLAGRRRIEAHYNTPDQIAKLEVFLLELHRSNQAF